MKKVLVIGKNGMLGSELYEILNNNASYIIKGTTLEDLDICNQSQVIEIISDFEPNYIINCAAYTNVDKAEEDFETAKLINSSGTENIAKVCGRLDIPLVYISTDYVFDGTKNEPYTPDDKPNPINNYGLTKLMGEEAVKKHCKKYYVARTSWLYGHYN